MSSDLAKEHTKLILDGTKIAWHQDRIAAWERRERVAPITIDMALTRACNYGCHYCYAQMQENERKSFTKETVINFVDDCAEIGVKGISLVSDGESTLSPFYVDAIERCGEKGVSVASGTNGYLLNGPKLERIMPYLTYLRINITAGEPKRYAEIMGVKEEWFYKVCENIKTMVKIKQQKNLKCTIGLQMVLDPRYGDQILPLAKLGKDLGADYTVVKHCSDDENGFLGTKYADYPQLYPDLREAEALSDDNYTVAVKWSKIEAAGKRSYSRCFGAPFLLQISGSGLVAPCGMLFGEAYKKFHIGNIVTERFRDIFKSDRYWEVMDYLASPAFDAQKMCGSLCLQHKVNEALDGHQKGLFKISEPIGAKPEHLNFI